jgi:hypothetical protein
MQALEIGAVDLSLPTGNFASAMDDPARVEDKSQSGGGASRCICAAPERAVVSAAPLGDVAEKSS